MARLPKAIKQHTVERIALSQLHGAVYNPRKITPKAKDGLRASLRRFGNVQPVVWNRKTGNIVGGHQRVQLLLEVGETETDVIVVELSEKDEKALNVTLNAKSITGEFDLDMLEPLLADIQLDDPDLFRDLNLDAFLSVPAADDSDGDEKETDEDAEKAVPQKVVSYLVVFDDEQQQQQFYLLLSKLKKTYPEIETTGGRIAEFAVDTLAAG